MSCCQLFGKLFGSWMLLGVGGGGGGGSKYMVTKAVRGHHREE
jgi:hypothetical protein